MSLERETIVDQPVMPGDSARPSSQGRPLVVDLDGTLVSSDLLIESALRLARTGPRQLVVACLGLRNGKAQLKATIAAASPFDAASLPYNPDVLIEVRAAREVGRVTVLATASNERIARAVAQHLGLFDEVLASDDQTNLAAHRKRAALIERFGKGGFDYAGNSRDDIVVFEAAADAIVVNASRSVERRARSRARVSKVIPRPAGATRVWLKALRMHQWAKNLLIFLPLAAGHQLNHPATIGHGALAFVVFSMCASSVYLLNDMLDLEEDRQHPRKRHRAFASGRLPLTSGLVGAPLLLIAAFVISALLLPWKFTAMLGVYYVATVAYSFALKRFTMVDVIVLAGLYATRIIAGAAAIDIKLTFWMLAFSMFLFLSLALAKRYAELKVVADRVAAGGHASVAGRGYDVTDMPLVQSFGVASGMLSVLVLALYIQDPLTLHLYKHPKVIWFACPMLLYWISRCWTFAHRGQLNDDPVLFALKDRVSLIIGVAIAIVFVIA